MLTALFKQLATSRVAFVDDSVDFSVDRLVCQVTVVLDEALFCCIVNAAEFLAHSEFSYHCGSDLCALFEVV